MLLLAGGLEGWLYGVGRIGWLQRGALIVAALGLLVPGLVTDLVGLFLCAGVYASALLMRRRATA